MKQITTLLTNIRRIVKLYDGMLKTVCDHYHLIPIEASIISFLYNNPGKDTAADIVQLRMLSKSNVSQAVESLFKNRCFCGVRTPPTAENPSVAHPGSRTDYPRNRNGP